MSQADIEEEVTKQWQALELEKRRPYEERFEQEQKRYKVRPPPNGRPRLEGC